MSKNNQTLEVISIGQIDVSKTNPRKHFDEKALKELSESIKEHGILQPVLVRPIETDVAEPHEHFELVCGERRYRAAILAGLNEIPANIRVLTDDEAFELQIIENLERKDVHPLDEADAFQKMIDSGKYTIADVAAKMAKSESFIAQRLKLVDLIDEVRGHFIAGKLGIGHAVLIARCNPTKQMSIYDDAKPWQGQGDPDYGTVAKLKEDIEDDSYDLTDTKFDLEDTELVKGCGACSVCPKRSGANPVLFEDMQEDRCFDETCFDNKQLAHIEKEVARIINNGENIVLVAGWSKPTEMVISICKQFNIDIVSGYDWAEDTGQNPNDCWITPSVKAFGVSGNNAGEYINIFLRKIEGVTVSSSSTGSVSNEEIELQQEINKIQERQDRARELDGEKVWTKIRAIDVNDLKENSTELFYEERDALCFAMISKMGYYGNQDVRKLVSDKFNIEFAKNEHFTKDQFNQISRIFILTMLPEGHGSHLNAVNNYAYTKALMMYKENEILEFENEQQAIAEKRIDKANDRIKELKSKIDKLKPSENLISHEPAGFSGVDYENTPVPETDPALENPNLFEKVSKKYALNNSYFKNRHPKSPANPLEVAQYYKQFGELPFDMDVEKNPNWLYETYIEYQKRNNVHHSQFFTPPATAKRIAELAVDYFSIDYGVLDACSGFGMLTMALRKESFIVTGFDFSNDMVELFKANEDEMMKGNCYRINYEDDDLQEIKVYSQIVSNPPYEVPKLTKFFERLHSDILADNGKAIILLPKGFMQKEKPKALVDILEKFDIIHSEDMTEDFAHTKIKAEIVVLEKSKN